MFAGIFNGQYVVWHNSVAQIDVRLVPNLIAVNELRINVGVNKYNPAPVVRAYVKSPSGALAFVAQMFAMTTPSLPPDGTFVDVVYRCTFAARSVEIVRFILSKDGVVGQELTPVKKYEIYNNSVKVVGGNTFETNSLGWKTGEVFETIFRYLDEPISTTHTVDIDTETHGLLPESRIRNDNLLARVADNEIISGAWDFESGQIRIERSGVLPVVASAGRIFQSTVDGSFYIGDGTNWIRLLKETEASIDFSWGFSRQSYVSPGTYLKFGESPVSSDEGMPIPAACRLENVVLVTSTVDMDGNSIDILRNGAVVRTVSLVNGTRMGSQENIGVDFQYKDIISVRASSFNVSFLDTPRVSLLFRSA